MKLHNYSSTGSATVKVIVTACIGGLIFFGTKIYLRIQDDAKRDKQLRAYQEYHQTDREQAATFQREAQQSGRVSNDTRAKGIDKMRQQFDKLGAVADRNLKEASEVMAELFEKYAPYNALLRRFQAEQPLDMSTVREKSDLDVRRKMGEEMVRRSAEILSLIDSMDSRLRGKLQKAGVPNAEAAVNEFKAGWDVGGAINRRCWNSSAEQTKSMISIFDLLETQWGKWKTNDGSLVFDDSEIAKQYNDLLDKISKAREEQIAAERELLELQRRTVR